MLLKLGSKGNDVVELQKKLKLTADGSFGPKTDAAVKQWQTKNNLSNQESLIPVKKNLMLSQIDDITGLKPVDKTGTVSASDKIIIVDKSKTPQNFTNKKRNKIKFYNKRIKSKQ